MSTKYKYQRKGEVGTIHEIMAPSRRTVVYPKNHCHPDTTSQLLGHDGLRKPFSYPFLFQKSDLSPPLSYIIAPSPFLRQTIAPSPLI